MLGGQAEPPATIARPGTCALEAVQIPGRIDWAALEPPPMLAGYGWIDERMPVAVAAKRPFGSRSR